MAYFDSYLLQEIFYHLNIETLQICCLVCKDWNIIITQGNFWKNKPTSKQSSSYHSGPYFSYSNFKTYLNNLHPIDYKISDYNSLKSLALKIKNPQNLKVISTNASSEDYNQISDNLLNYDYNFWSSRPQHSPDTNEFIIFKLEHESLIFTVNFKLYRVRYQKGILFPPKFIKISIGKTKQRFEYESDEFEVKLNENYNTILILPTIISGRYIKLTLIGKLSRDPESQFWYNVLRFVEIIGFSLKNTLDRLLEMCLRGDFKSFSNVLSPFYFERLLRYGKVEEYLASEGIPRSDISAYFREIYQGEAIRNDFKYCCEIVGNYLFDRGEYEKAMEHYMSISDTFGCARVYIVKKEFKNLIKIMNETSPRNPSRMWVINAAEEIGGESLRNELLAFFHNSD